MSFEKAIPVKINGVPGELLAPANETLLDCLRRHGQFDVKSGCEKGDCGACAVQIDGEAVDSCLTLAWTVEGRSITTLEGLNDINKPQLFNAVTAHPESSWRQKRCCAKH